MMGDTAAVLLEENDKQEEDNSNRNGDGFHEALTEFLLVSVGWQMKSDFHCIIILNYQQENALTFRHTLLQSPSLPRLLQSSSSSSANAIGDPQRRHPPTMLLPSPDSLLSRFAPKMFNRDLGERKAHFEDDFFVLVLRRMRVDVGQPKGTWITRLDRKKQQFKRY